MFANFDPEVGINFKDLENFDLTGNIKNEGVFGKVLRAQNAINICGVNDQKTRGPE